MRVSAGGGCGGEGRHGEENSVRGWSAEERGVRRGTSAVNHNGRLDYGSHVSHSAIARQSVRTHRRSHTQVLTVKLTVQ